MLLTQTGNDEELADALRIAERDPEATPVAAPETSALVLESWRLGPMVGRSLIMQHLFARMRCTAPHFRLAAIEGEAGAGKLLAAQTLSRMGPAAAGPFVPSSAAAFLARPAELWREARSGLLYLARVDELTQDQQRSLRDFLERAAHERIRTHAVTGPFQIVAGALEPLRRLAASGSFRSDLAAHLTAIRFAVPPLRERRDDIPLLAGLFLRDWAETHRKTIRGFAPGALSRLAAYPWPGNVRELNSAVAAAALDCTGQWIRPIDIPPLQGAAPLSPLPAGEAPADDPNLDRAILHHIVRVLARVNGNKVRAARMLGISRSTLYRLLEPEAPASTAAPGQ